ncbi:MAG: CHRD domain-containing protein [Actinomycetota bacterium]
MRARILLGAIVSLAVIGLLVAPSLATPGGTFKADPTGYEEVPAVSTDASGTFRAKVDPAGPTIEYELSYSDIQNAFAAHIHLGQAGVNGGVSAFLCGGGDKPVCPATGGTVSGSIDAADVIGPESQGIAPGEIEELIDAMIAGATYANVHTTDGVPPANTGPGDFPGGEIRGQIS